MSQQRHEWADENGSAMSLEVRYGLAVVRRDGGLVEARPELMKEVFRLAAEVETIKVERNEAVRIGKEALEAAYSTETNLALSERWLALRARIAAREQPAEPVPNEEPR